MTTDNTDTTYLVTWSIDITADSPQAAALEAKRTCNEMGFGPDDANVFEVRTPAYLGDTDTGTQRTHTVDLGATEITDDGEIIPEDTDTAPEAPVDTPSHAVAGTDFTDTETLIVTEELTLEIQISRQELREAGIDPEDTASEEFDSYIADITSAPDLGSHAYTINVCDRSCSWSD